MDKRPIGVFDSGVGGLSILREMRRLLPNENFVFLADQLHVPYGEKSATELVDLSSRITDHLLTHDIKLMVVACNTATCYAIEALRKKYDLPIVGTVPAVRPAAENTKTGTIAVIATPATSKSKVLKQLIKDYCQDINVLNISCKDLENSVETGKMDSTEINTLLEKYLKRVKSSDADYLVLGCTHYPFLKDVIRKIVGPKIKIIDSGSAIAKRVRSLLTSHKLKNAKTNKGRVSYFTTGNKKGFETTVKRLLGKKIKAKKIRI